MLWLLLQPFLQLCDLFRLQAAVGRHVAEVHQHTNGMAVDLIEGVAIAVLGMTAGAEFQGEGFAGFGFWTVWGEVEPGTRLLGYELIEAGREFCIQHQIFAHGMDAERTRGMTLIAAGSFEFRAGRLELGEVVEGRSQGEVLNDGEVGPAAVGGRILDEQIHPDGIVGEA